MMNNPNALMTTEQLAIEQVKQLANIVRSLRFDVFKQDLDYGVIPGTGNKPTLLLPGMEKLMRALHLRAEYVEKSRIEDFENNRIFYRYECRLIDYEDGLCVSTAIGSANSMESKWRWRDQNRKCPNCGKETIIKGKAEYGGGWLCFAKKGGCGAKFADGDSAIEGQATGRIENPDIFDQMNTIDKIAQKRALASAIKGAANVSEFFTVDLEDFQAYDTRPAPENVVEGMFSVVEPTKSEASVRSTEPSAAVRGAGIQQPEPEPLPVADEDLPETVHTDPNAYHCNQLIVTQTRTARQFVLRVAQTQTNIPLTDMSVLEGVYVGDVLAVELKARGAPYVLVPTWVVVADRAPDGAWQVLSVATELPVP